MGKRLVWHFGMALVKCGLDFGVRWQRGDTGTLTLHGIHTRRGNHDTKLYKAKCVEDAYCVRWSAPDLSWEVCTCVYGVRIANPVPTRNPSPTHYTGITIANTFLHG